jgi:hypothetical protein
MLFAALLLPATGWSQEKPARAESSATPATSLAVQGETVRGILRTVALAHPAATATATETVTPIAQGLALKFRSDRRIDHVECDALQCYAYSRDGEVLFATPRDPGLGALSDVPKSDAALACLDTNDLLTTFERVDRCRGIGIGAPLQWSNGGFNAPVPGRNPPRDPP